VKIGITGLLSGNCLRSSKGDDFSVTVDDVSRDAYEQMIESGRITELQDLAFSTVREFYEEYGYWPTYREAHAFLALEKDHTEAQLKGPAYIRRRLSELVVDPEDSDPDLLEKQEPRIQKYLEEEVDDIESTAEARPVKIRDDWVRDWIEDNSGPGQVDEDEYRTEEVNGVETYVDENGDRYVFKPGEESEGEADASVEEDDLVEGESKEEPQDEDDDGASQQVLLQNGEVVGSN